MSDLSIPGVNGGQYDKLVEALIKKERIPRDREAESLEQLKLQDASWRQINQLSAEVRDVARNLYSFNNPFSEKNAESSNERALTATATRAAQNQTVTISVIQTAREDKFLSDSIDKGLEIPKGKYTFKIGEKEISVNWKGGKYKGFIDLVNSRAKDMLNISEIKVTPDTKALLFASKIAGEKNRLEFEDDAFDFALKMGIIKKNDSNIITPSVSSLETQPESTGKIDFSETVSATSRYMMELRVTLRTPAEGEARTSSSKDSAVYEQIGSVSYKGVTVQNEASKDGLDTLAAQNNGRIRAPKPPDMNVFSLESVKGAFIPLPPISNTEEPQTITVPLSEYGNVKALAVHNNNGGKSVVIEDIRIYDPKATGEYVPVNAVSTAQDAIINFEGIQVKRDKNDIDDLMPGVTLHAHEATEKQEKITVKPDKEAAKNSIIEFVAKYNRLLAQINILTQNRPEVIEELTYFSEPEKEDAEKKLGLMQTDTTLTTLKSNLRKIISSPYKPNEDSALFMLNQLGISTKSDSSAGIDRARLRGYLEIDEKQLDDVLETDMDAVRLFFGFDSNGDILVDSGLAHTLHEQINPYTQRGGIFSVKTGTLKTKMDFSQKKIAAYDKKLAEKELQLKQKYGNMEGTLKNLQKQSQTIENFDRQNRQNSNQR